MDTTTVLLALLAGVAAGALFAYLRIPVPAPPTLPGIMGIVGLFLGYRIVNTLGAGVDVASYLP